MTLKFTGKLKISEHLYFLFFRQNFATRSLLKVFVKGLCFLVTVESTLDGNLGGNLWPDGRSRKTMMQQPICNDGAITYINISQRTHSKLEYGIETRLFRWYIMVKDQ